LRAGRIFAVVAGNGTVLARFEDRNTGMKMALAQDMLLIVVRHHAGDFAGTTPNALLAVSHNKTIHNHTCFWFNNLILYMYCI
jgi:G:T-mismatch repair DNA endonuclease (very short patch repair protein)